MFKQTDDQIFTTHIYVGVKSISSGNTSNIVAVVTATAAATGGRELVVVVLNLFLLATLVAEIRPPKDYFLHPFS